MLSEFVDSILDVDPDANIIALGDFNDFEFSETLEHPARRPTSPT